MLNGGGRVAEEDDMKAIARRRLVRSLCALILVPAAFALAAIIQFRIVGLNAREHPGQDGLSRVPIDLMFLTGLVAAIVVLLALRTYWRVRDRHTSEQGRTRRDL